MLRPTVVALTAFLAASPATLFAQNRSLPPQAAADFDGELEVQFEDSNAGARMLHFLNMSNGQRLKLEFPGRGPELLTGTKVRAHGVQQNNTLMLTDSSSVQVTALASSDTFGLQSTLVILINFTDNATQPYTVAAAQSVTFDQTRDFYLENSYQQTAMTGTVVGWFTIAATSATCDTSTWATLADQAAANASVNLANYPRRIYGFPQTAACGWWGLGSVGGGGSSSLPSRAWINGSYTIRVVAHEYGHNLGDYHSHSSVCDTAGCTASEYGDDRDIMGGTTAHLNAFQKERLGWLNYGSSPPITTVTQSNNYWIDAYSPYGTSPKALKVQKAVDANGKRTWYYVESRARLGFDGSLTEGVVVHTGSEASGDSSYEIDLQPGSTTFDGLLDPGQTFTDATANLSITTVSSDVTGALINVTFNGGSPTPSPTPSCARANPTVTLTSSQSQAVKAGTMVGYTASVMNNDSAACTAAAFNLAASVPSGWMSSLGGSLTLAPGASGTTTLQVTSSSTAAAGSYTVSVSAANGQDATKSGAASATYTVSAPVTTSITMSVATDRASYSTNSNVKVTVTVLAGTAGAAGASVTFKFTRANGSTATDTATTDASGKATVTLRVKPKDPTGVYQVNSTAALNGSSASGTTSFTVK